MGPPLVLLLSAASILTPQTADAEHVLHWFPLGTYMAIAHRNLYELENAESFARFEEYLAPALEHVVSYLPASLRQSVLSYTSALLHKLKRIRSDEIAGLPEVEGEVEWHTSDRLRVYQYADLDPLIEQALAAGELSETEAVRDERPIYKSAAVGDEERFYYATITQELLVAGSLRNINLMIDSGLGLDLNITDDKYYVDLVEIVPDLGSNWVISFSFWTTLDRLERLRAEGRSSASLRPLEEKLRRDERFRVISWHFEDEVCCRYIHIFGDADFAEERFNSGGCFIEQYAFVDEIEEFNASARERRTEEIEGKVITYTVRYDEELFAKMAAAGAAAQRHKEAQSSEQQQ